MDKLIRTFSIKALADFFKKAVSSFKIDNEDLTYIMEDKEYPDFSELTRVGNVEFKNSEELIVFACKYNGHLSERSSKKKQFEIAKLVLKEDFKDGAIFVFYDESGKFRFSFIRRNWDGKADKKYSSWKRFTYFVNPEEHNKTFRQRIGNCTFKDLDTIQEAFSVEKLTKEFYNELFAWYQWALSEEVGITFPHNTETPEDDRIKLEEQIIRLITRLLFVWFIKQKNLVPDDFFQTERLANILKDFDAKSQTEGNYYNAILQNLFFATLNKSIENRGFAEKKGETDIKTDYRYKEMFNLSEQQILDLFKPIPFLNGGLFECLDKTKKMDGIKYALDGFSRNATKSANGNYRHRAFIPNAVFFDEEKGILPLLKRYNFTVEENAPNEIQVALDPELLGKVFENLLGAFNPETKETARKQSGSFYTPREIVDYMVNESLLAYLQNDFPDLDESVLRDLFEDETLPESLVENQSLCQKISHKLREVKILDPACGSGAFPMGILNKMVEVLEKLDGENEASIYDLKLHLIEECIYGIDIQTIATQISKLRFFISLVVEQDEMDLSKPEANYGVLTLPNLETKFVAANTLIGIKRKPAQGNLFEDPEIEVTKQELLRIRKEHFYAKTAGAKKRLREQDADLRDKLAKLLEENGDFASEDALQFAQWNPYDQNASSPFFDPEWMFGLEEGFDIVIGNPPYFSLSTDSSVPHPVTGKAVKHNKLYLEQNFNVFAATGDIYTLFYERGWQLLKDKGFLCYITSNKWMRAGYGESTREFFATYTNPILLIDFAGQKIFESATVDTNILLFSKDKNRQQTKACVVKEKVLNNLSDYFRQNATVCNFTNSESWVILSEIEQRIKAKIEAVGTPLKDWDINIYRGILTGYNEAFIINGDKKREILANCKTQEEKVKTDELIRPILRGRDIKRYGYDFADLWLINTHNGIKEKGIPPIDIKDYPAIKKHLDQYYPRLEKRADKGDTPYNLRNCAYMEDFSKQKLIYPNMTKYLPFVYDDKGFLTNQKCFIITGEKVEFLTAFFNSSLFKYCFRDNFPELQGGTRELSKIFFEKIPAPKVSEETNLEFKKIIDEIQQMRENKETTKETEMVIDKLIFDLYNLTYEERIEIGFIEIL